MQGCLTKLRILFHCLLDGGQFKLARSVEKDEGQRSLPGAAFSCFPIGQERNGRLQPRFGKEAQMVQSVTYQRETRTVPFQGKTIVLESLTPVLSPKEKERRKKEIERCLYDVFSKYRQSRR